MILVPAIDIMDGKAVRLTRGAFDERTVYDADPVEAALRWEAGGARALHVVDLDGARGGAPANLDVISAIAQRVRVPFQVGGGVRSTEACGRWLIAAGASRVVLGTAALSDVDLLDAAVACWATGWWYRWMSANAGRPPWAGRTSWTSRSRR